MLGIFIGLVSGVGLLTFLNRDPVAVKQHKDEKERIKQEKMQVEKKQKEQLEQLEKQKNTPQAIEAREKKQKEMKEKMLKNLSQSERKMIQEYMQEQKKTGKSEGEIMKDAGTKAMLFFMFVVLVFVFLIVAVIVLLGGDSHRIMGFFEQVKTQGQQFVYWNFPRLENATIWGFGGEL